MMTRSTMKWILGKFNTFSNAKQVAETVINELPDINHLSLLAVAVETMAYRYVEEGKNPYDDRSRASKEYAYEYRDVYRKILKDELNVTINAESGRICLSRAVDRRAVGEDIFNWIQIIEQEHPTIIQSYFRGMVGYYSEQAGLPEGTFPFI